MKGTVIVSLCTLFVQIQRAIIHHLVSCMETSHIKADACYLGRALCFDPPGKRRADARLIISDGKCFSLSQLQPEVSTLEMCLIKTDHLTKPVSMTQSWATLLWLKATTMMLLFLDKLFHYSTDKLYKLRTTYEAPTHFRKVRITLQNYLILF